MLLVLIDSFILVNIIFGLKIKDSVQSHYAILCYIFMQDHLHFASVYIPFAYILLESNSYELFLALFCYNARLTLLCTI